MKPHSIHLFLPNGNPRSMRLADMPARTLQALYFSRSSLKEAMQRKEAQQVSIYFLIGEDEEGMRVYVGETENFANRVADHNYKKDFWTEAIVVSSKNEYLTKTHVRYLEHVCYARAKDIGRFKPIDSQTVPSEPHMTEAEKANMADFVDTIGLLTSTLGFPILEPLESKTQTLKQYFCKGPQCDATGVYSDDGFTVFAGSKARAEHVAAYSSGQIAARQKLIDQGKLKRDGEYYIFTEDTLFKTPSGAAIVCMARPANGWTEWKDSEGLTLNDEFRS